MSVMKKLLEINDELVRTVAELEQLRSDQKTLQEICSIGKGRITELQAERDELRKEQTKLQGICADGGRRITELQAERDEAVMKMSLLQEQVELLQAELDATRKQLQELCTKPAEPQPVKVQEGGLLRDVSHYTEMAETDTPATDDAPAEPQPVQEVTLSAYIVADKLSPEALRIVWATEEWIQQSKFGIVHPMKDVMFLDQDRFTPEQFSLTLYLKK